MSEENGGGIQGSTGKILLDAGKGEGERAAKEGSSGPGEIGREG